MRRLKKNRELGKRKNNLKIGKCIGEKRNNWKIKN